MIHTGKGKIPLNIDALHAHAAACIEEQKALFATKYSGSLPKRQNDCLPDNINDYLWM
jgi:hypothetical protein